MEKKKTRRKSLLPIGGVLSAVGSVLVLVTRTVFDSAPSWVGTPSGNWLDGIIDFFKVALLLLGVDIIASGLFGSGVLMAIVGAVMIAVELRRRANAIPGEQS